MEELGLLHNQLVIQLNGLHCFVVVVRRDHNR